MTMKMTKNTVGRKVLILNFKTSSNPKFVWFSVCGLRVYSLSEQLILFLANLELIPKI